MQFLSPIGLNEHWNMLHTIRLTFKRTGMNGRRWAVVAESRRQRRTSPVTVWDSCSHGQTFVDALSFAESRCKDGLWCPVWLVRAKITYRRCSLFVDVDGCILMFFSRFVWCLGESFWGPVISVTNCGFCAIWPALRGKQTVHGPLYIYWLDWLVHLFIHSFF